MSIPSEIRLKLELKGFEDGLNDARRDTIDEITYQINSEYRSGVDTAHQWAAEFTEESTLHRISKPL